MMCAYMDRVRSQRHAGGIELDQQERWLTVEEAAERLSVHDQTVRRWLRAGKLQGTSINRRAGWRIRESEIERFLTEGPAHPEERKLAAS